MTGEMSWINESGEDSNGDIYELHAAIARELKGTLKPFDVYQGPYIAIGPDYAVGNSPYRCPIPSMGVRLWVCPDDGGAFYTIYREDTEKQSFPFCWDDIQGAIEAAKSLFD